MNQMKRSTDNNNEDIKNMSARQYLDNTVVPILLQAMTELAKVRPAKPIEFIANYLIEHNPDKASKEENEQR